MRRSFRSVLALAAAALCALAVLPPPARAQVGSATDIITGLVTSEDGPVEGANVQAFSLETQITRTARTDARGRFTILFPDGGGQYRMTVRAVGMNPRIEMIQRNADEDRLVWNVRVIKGTVQLAAINVQSGPQITRAPEGPTPGNSERNFTDAQLSRLPTDASDLALPASSPSAAPTRRPTASRSRASVPMPTLSRSTACCSAAPASRRKGCATRA